MTITFKEEDKFIQCVLGGVVVARITQDTGEVGLVRDEIPAKIPSMDLSAIYCKAEEIKEELERNTIANRLHTLPNGDGIDLSRVTAVKFIRAMEVLELKQRPSVRIEHESSAFMTVPCESLSPFVRVEQEVASNKIDALTLPFDSEEEAIAFRGELIKLVNRKE